MTSRSNATALEPRESTRVVPYLANYAEEPPCGSVLLLHGHTGTAYQRHFNDGLWHAAGQRAGLAWSTVYKQAGHSGVLVVYDAPVDDEQ